MEFDEDINNLGCLYKNSSMTSRWDGYVFNRIDKAILHIFNRCTAFAYLFKDSLLSEFTIYPSCEQGQYGRKENSRWGINFRVAGYAQKGDKYKNICHERMAFNRYNNRTGEELVNLDKFNSVYMSIYHYIKEMLSMPYFKEQAHYEFPIPVNFKNRLIVCKVCEEFFTKPFSQDVEDTCPDCLKKHEEMKGVDTGYVYFINARGQDYFKVGYSGSYPEKRMFQLSTEIMFKLDLIGYLYCDNHRKVERALHRLLEPFRMNGEWFALDLATLLDKVELLGLKSNYTTVKIDDPLPKPDNTILAEGGCGDPADNASTVESLV